VCGRIAGQPDHILRVSGRHHAQWLNLAESGVGGVEAAAYEVEFDVAAKKSAEIAGDGIARCGHGSE